MAQADRGQGDESGQAQLVRETNTQNPLQENTSKVIISFSPLFFFFLILSIVQREYFVAGTEKSFLKNKLNFYNRVGLLLCNEKKIYIYIYKDLPNS